MISKRVKYIITVSWLAKMIDSSDVCRRNHCYKVERQSLLICHKLGLPVKEIKIIKIASMLHDIGKVGIDLNLIKKPSKLREDEWVQIRRHPEIGANIVRQMGFMEGVDDVIKHHHARYAGGGYPDADISGGDIPIGSRIISVTDAFDAMISDRPYRKAMPREAAFKELTKCSGSQFDPRVVDAFLTITQ